jgi:hypothetical protein
MAIIPPACMSFGAADRAAPQTALLLPKSLSELGTESYHSPGHSLPQSCGSAAAASAAAFSS